MGLIERIKSALGLGTSTRSAGSTASADRGADRDSTAGGEPTPVSEIEGDDDVETTQTVVDPGGRSDGADVTVEHEPDTRSEDAVKGTDTANTGTSADVASAESATDEADAETDAEDGEDTTPADDDTTAADDDDVPPAADLETVKGIGPAYAGRLRDAGVEDVAALAAADAAELAERTDMGEGRLQTFIDRAAEM